MNLNIFLLLLFVFIISCKNELRTGKESEKIVSPEKARLDTVKKSSDKKQRNDLEVDIRDIKKQLDAVTTTFLSKEEVVYYQDRKKNNFYGDYTLIKNDSLGNATRIVGNMIVYDSINPYVYEKDTDEFIEINLWDTGVTLMDGNLQVGISKESLIDFLGNDFTSNKDILIFKHNHVKGFFKIKNDSVTNIKIGMYREYVTDKEILKYE